MTTLNISISSEVEARLKQRAAAAGKDATAYAASLIEQAVVQPSLNEILAPFRKQVVDSGMADEELDSFYEELRDEAHQSRRDTEQ